MAIKITLKQIAWAYVHCITLIAPVDIKDGTHTPCDTIGLGWIGNQVSNLTRLVRALQAWSESIQYLIQVHWLTKKFLKEEPKTH